MFLAWVCGPPQTHVFPLLSSWSNPYNSLSSSLGREVRLQLLQQTQCLQNGCFWSNWKWDGLFKRVVLFCLSDYLLISCEYLVCHKPVASCVSQFLIRVPLPSCPIALFLPSSFSGINHQIQG